MSHHIEATNGDVGHLEGPLVDEETCAIRYIIVNTRQSNRVTRIGASTLEETQVTHPYRKRRRERGC